MSANPKMVPGPPPGGHPAYPGGVPLASQPPGGGANQPPPPPATAQQVMQAQIDLEAKRMQDLIESITLVTTIRDDINTILDNVGKTNSSLAQTMAQIQQQQQQAAASESGGDAAAGGDVSSLPSSIANVDVKDLEFLEKTDNKYLLEKVVDINRCISELEKLIAKEPQPLQIFNYPTPDFNAILLEQVDDRVPSYKLVSMYRWIQRLMETINTASFVPYRRFSQPYADRKSTKFKTYPLKPMKREDIEKMAQQMMSNQEAIKVMVAQKSEHEFVMDLIMPQNFKFVILLFDLNVEKLQVRPVDNRIPKIYQSNKQRAEDICSFDFEHKNSSNVFHRLEQNCLLACAYFRTEQNANHLRYLLNWLKSYVNLFNAKCSKCEKHLLNGLPPTWRDLKTVDPLHDECKIY